MTYANPTHRFECERTHSAFAALVRDTGADAGFAEVIANQEAARIGGRVVALFTGNDSRTYVAVEFESGRDVCATWLVCPRPTHDDERIGDTRVCFESGRYWTRSARYSDNAAAIVGAIVDAASRAGIEWSNHS